MKILIDKEKLEARIAELDKERFYGSELNSDYRIGQQQAYKEILQQGEEYNENEVIEFAEWCSKENWKIQGDSNNTWRKGYSANMRFYSTQELFKLYKDERNTKFGKLN